MRIPRIADGRTGAKIEIGFAAADDGFGGFAFGLEAEPVVRPAADEPVDVFLDGVHVFDVFLGGIGVVHAQIADAAEFAGDAEVEADGFGVADVELAVGFGRKAGVNEGIALFGQMRGDDVPNEIGGGGRAELGQDLAWSWY